ncbi:MAG: glutamyl-tRNA amidotransferase [Dehalococcoidia bacterium]|nr:glutamyl-tRNA amidotransferase [Dehalococcoidia bacterium]
MGLREQVTADLRKAMRARNEHAVSAIRMLRAAIINFEISQRGDPSEGSVPDEELLNVVRKEIAAHREALEYAEKAARTELIAKEQAMIAVLEQYMPAQLSQDEMRSEVEKLVAEHGPEFRQVMPQAARALRGRADLGQVNKLVRELTGG